MNKRLPFNAWSKERIQQGRKIFTSRKEKYEDDDRVIWISPPLPWWFIRNYLYKQEGADSPSELQNVIHKIFKRKVEDDELFYVHMGDFREIGNQDDR